MKTTEEEAEMNQDRYDQSQVSDINLDNGSVSGNLGIEDYAITELYSDFILCEMLDMKQGFKVTKSGLKIPDTQVKAWRKAKVHLVSPIAQKYGKTKVGDFVTFPNDRGLQVGRVQYVNEAGDVVTLENGVMLNEQRLGAKLVELEDADDE